MMLAARAKNNIAASARCRGGGAVSVIRKYIGGNRRIVGGIVYWNPVASARLGR